MTMKSLFRRFAAYVMRMLRALKGERRRRRIVPANCDPMVTERILVRYRKTFEILGRS